MSSGVAVIAGRPKGELTVLVQHAELEAEGISPSDPVSDWLENEPLYLLSDRLRLMDVGWYYEGDILYLTSQTVSENERQAKVPYLLGGSAPQVCVSPAPRLLTSGDCPRRTLR